MPINGRGATNANEWEGRNECQGGEFARLGYGCCLFYLFWQAALGFRPSVAGLAFTRVCHCSDEIFVLLIIITA